MRALSCLDALSELGQGEYCLVVGLIVWREVGSVVVVAPLQLCNLQVSSLGTLLGREQTWRAGGRGGIAQQGSERAVGIDHGLVGHRNGV